MMQNEARHWQESYLAEPKKSKKVIVKVKKKGWLTKGEKALYSLFALLIIVSSIYIVSYSSTIDSISRDAQNLEGAVKQKAISNDNLTFEIKILSEPARILQIAEENGLKIQDTKVKSISKSSHN